MYVERDSNGKIVGAYMLPKPGFTLESLPDTDPALVAFMHGPKGSDVDAQREKVLAAGFADTGAGGTGKTWQCDAKSLANWTAIAASAQPWALGIAPAGVPAPNFSPWGTDNQPVFLTASAAYQLFQVRVMTWVTGVYIYARSMKSNLDAGQPPNAQNDITQGWPTS